MEPIKCVVVGDHDCGKTEFLISYKTGQYPQDYKPMVFNNDAVTVTIGGKPYTLALFDTSGQEDYEKLRLLPFRQADVILVLFSVIIPSSFDNAKEKWIPVIRHHCPNVPYLLVGTEIEKRTDPETLDRLKKKRKSIVSNEEGRAMAVKVLARKYLECSVVTQEGLKNVFDEAILAALEPPGKQNFFMICIVLL